jgi:DNA polymerase-3 subunit gamma/tau
LFEALMKGESPAAMGYLDSLYKAGADPIMVLQDLLDLTHYLTKVKVSPEVASDKALPEAERVRGTALSKSLSIPVLTRTWQIFLKGVSEVQQAFSPQQALEMVLIRLLFAADQPTPGDLAKQIKDGMQSGAIPQGGGNSGFGAPRGTAMQRTGAVSATAVASDPQQGYQAQLHSFEDVVALFGQMREVLLQAALENYVHLVKFEQGHLEVRIADGAPRTLVGDITKYLNQWTGQRWMISLSREKGAETIGSVKRAAVDAVRSDVEASPVVAAVLLEFPGARILEIQPRTPD